MTNPKKALFSKEAVTTREMLPEEKDEFTANWFRSLSNSRISLLTLGISVVVMSLLGHWLFVALIKFAEASYLTVSSELLTGELIAAKIGVGTGGLMLLKGIFNLRKKHSAKNE
ncbi:MAG: hypothetical protein WC565_01420 [Parcubacteria group bacterium]